MLRSNGLVVNSGDKPEPDAASVGEPMTGWSAHASVHEAVKQRVRAQLGRRWPVGSCLPPIRQLARELDAGESSTYRAMRDLAAEGLLVSRRGQGTYVMRAAADPALAAQQAPAPSPGRRLVNLLFCRQNPDAFLRNMAEALASVLEGAGVQVRVHRRDEPGPALTYPDIPGDAWVLLNPPAIKLSSPPGVALLVVSTLARVDVDMVGGYDVVGIDQYQGGLLAGRCLRQAGCRSVFFIGASEREGSSQQRLTSQMRFEGLQAGWGKPIPPEHVYLRPYTSQLLGVQAAAHYLAMADRPDGVFAITDDAASSFQIGLMTHGLSPRRDYQLVGFDGQEQGRLVVGGPLTTVQIPAELMGLRAGELLRDRLAEPSRAPHRLALGCLLREGATTRPPVADAARSV